MVVGTTIGSVVTQIGFVLGSVAYAAAQANGYLQASAIRAMRGSARHWVAGHGDEGADPAGIAPARDCA